MRAGQGGRAGRAARVCVGIAALAGLTLGAAACDALLGEEDRFLALRDGAADADGAVDAARLPGTDGSVGGDADTDAGDANRDAATSGEGGDAASDADGEAGPFCQGGPPHYLCSDFDEGAILFDYSVSGAQWVPLIYGGGLTALEPATAPESFPGVFYAQVTAPGGGATGVTGAASGAALELALPTDTAHLQLDLDLLAPLQATTQGVVSFVSLVQKDTAANAYGTWIEATTTGPMLVNVVAAGATGPITVTRGLPQSSQNWQHVRLVMERAAAGHLTLTVGGVVALDQDMRTLSEDTQSFALIVGLNSGASSSALNAAYDNVTFDLSE